LFPKPVVLAKTVEQNEAKITLYSFVAPCNPQVGGGVSLRRSPKRSGNYERKETYLFIKSHVSFP
jgi:hypothetical protein